MDDITRAVRKLYTEFPYPSVPWQLRTDSFPRYLASLVERSAAGELAILDAGCGTGASLIPIAALHRDARVVGMDVSPAAIEAVREEALERGLAHLEAYEADLMDFATLAPLREGSPGGFDVIYASGVIHHLSDPARGLAHLARLLSPSGVLSLMVYGPGRRPVERLAEAVSLARSGDAGLPSRIAFTRTLAAAVAGRSAATWPPFDDTAYCSDVEVVDRYLHVQARSYTVSQALELVREAGLTFLRWAEPRHWSPTALLGAGALADELEALPELVRYRVIECLFDRPALELYAGHGALRRPPRPADLASAVVAVNPQVSIEHRERRYADSGWTEELKVQLRAGPTETLLGIRLALVRVCETPMPAEELIAQALEVVPANDAQAALLDLIEREILYLV